MQNQNNCGITFDTQLKTALFNLVYMEMKLTQFEFFFQGDSVPLIFLHLKVATIETKTP